MKIDLIKNVILKPQGKHTQSAIVPFHCLRCYLDIYHKEINTKSAISAIQAWKESGQSPANALRVLESVIVDFGGGHRIWGKYNIYYSENVSFINEQLKTLFKQEDIDSALKSATDIQGLGESYGSKLLRFVSPDFVVLDSILREELCGNMPYAEFNGLCSQIANVIGVTPVDVEAALFTFVQLAKPEQRKQMWRQHQLPNESNAGFIVCRCGQSTGDDAQMIALDKLSKSTPESQQSRLSGAAIEQQTSKTQHTYTLQITDTRDVVFGIKEFNGGSNLIGYISKGVTGGDAGAIIAYERLRELFIQADVTEKPEERINLNSASKFGNPTGQNIHWRAYDVSAYHDQPLSADAPPETASTIHRRKAQDAFRFLEHYFNVQYAKSK
ncbi:MAG: hypothetical protein WCO60_16850 [Verrucomicrobiota bacterium]